MELGPKEGGYKIDYHRGHIQTANAYSKGQKNIKAFHEEWKERLIMETQEYWGCPSRVIEKVFCI